MYTKEQSEKSTCSNITASKASAASLTRSETGFRSFSSFIFTGSPGLLYSRRNKKMNIRVMYFTT